MTILDLLATHQDALHRTLNLVASENLMSPDALKALSSDLAGRYCIPPVGERPAAIWDYPNQRAPRELDRIACGYVRKIFGAAYADCRPLSGNNAAGVLLKALARRDGLVMSVPGDCGGHFATEAICRDVGCELVFMVYDRATGEIDIDATLRAVSGRRPDLIFLDASAILFPYPVRQLRKAFGPDVVIAYDASHVMGLIAGGQFQDPLAEGADLLQGSTHKTLFGPQKGLFACKENGKVAQRIADGVVPLFASNVHVHHVAALAVALEEIVNHGRPYAAAVVSNARALAQSLADHGCVPAFEAKGFTRSHQVIVPIGERDGAERVFFQLEEAGIHTNCIRIPCDQRSGLRLGVAELTRRGMTNTEIQVIGRAISDVITGRKSPAKIRATVEDMSGNFQKLLYWRDAGETSQSRTPSKSRR